MNPLRPAQPSPAIRIILVDDSKDLRAVWSRVLARTPGVQLVADVGALAEVLPTAERTGPDVVILDLSLDGAETTPLIEPLTRAGAKVIVYSGRDGARLVASLRAMGAAGFVGKHEEPGVLLEAVRRAAQGGVYFPSRLMF